MSTALIGYSGFVGGNLLAKRPYQAVFRSSDIGTIRGQAFEHIVCAGVQAMKWWANLHPDDDRAGIERLLQPLEDVSAGRFTLISTIDVYPAPRDVNEDSVIERAGHHAYGLNRLHVEDWIRARFPRVLIVRLPGLFGPGLKKNVIFDMLHNNDVHKVHPGGVFQYYDLRRMADDIDHAWELELGLLNVSTEPIGTSEICARFFPGTQLVASGSPPVGYDMRSKHAAAWGGADGYLYPKDQVMNDLGDWLEDEKGNAGA